MNLDKEIREALSAVITEDMGKQYLIEESGYPEDSEQAHYFRNEAGKEYREMLINRATTQILKAVERDKQQAIVNGQNDMLIEAANKANQEYEWQEVDNWTFDFGSTLRNIYIKRKLYKLYSIQQSEQLSESSDE